MEPTEKDIAWARKHGWTWDGEAFFPTPIVRVIPNPSDPASGWCPWLQPIGALQMEAPFASVRAALRVAEEVRRGRPMPLNEMSCAED